MKDEKKSLRELTAEAMARTRRNNPEFARRIEELFGDAEIAEAGEAALRVGALAPGFELPNPQGERVALADLLEKGPVVLTFYRGGWCPYCNLQLVAMQQRLQEIHELAAELVAVSPQVPDESLSLIERAELAFPLLSDGDAKVAASYGVAWKVPELIREHMRKDRGLDLVAINGGNGSVLPIPATFVLNAEGEVSWRFVEVDYRKRAEPEEIMAVLREL